MDFNNLFHYHDGKLYWKAVKKSKNSRFNNKLAGSLRNDGYIGIYIKGEYFFAHRIIWEMFKGEIPEGKTIDHKDLNRANNRISNLRLCDQYQNNMNKTKTIANKSGYKGVSFHKQKKKWVAKIGVKGKSKFLGFFDSPEEAAEAYKQRAIELYGEFARW